MSSTFEGPPAISYEYKVGVKREIINALRDVAEVWPDERLRGKIHVVNEWPTSEIQYPMIVMKFTENVIKNIGLGHYEVDYDADGTPYKLLHWLFTGQLHFTVYANTPVDRDYVAVGLLNLLAFGNEIPEFAQFHREIDDYDFVALQMNTEHIYPGGDSTEPAPWQTPDDHIFSTTYSVDILGEFFTDPRTSDLVQISKVVAYPYRKDQAIPQGSQEFGPGFDDRTVPWTPATTS